jgi:hypothetical protein
MFTYIDCVLYCLYWFYCIVYVYLLLFVLSVPVQGRLPQSAYSVAVKIIIIPADINVVQTEAEMKLKYKSLGTEIQRM